ncbi:hypothetical protein [Acidiphilium iwatense]|uniref:Uncharacterized protein n=1 Tax=Acidiphilium iwatense TaxID=768198 RepID=A0ABS9DZV0_9PROT|nr:hypothetical protein [Acidiphilium iwatense]MCF3948271.1 hypothetical protein [Acidiphilium iwatense]
MDRPTGRAYEIEHRSDALGGGWRLRLTEDGEESGGGVFPAIDDETDKDAYQDALNEGEAWVLRLDT